MLLMSLHNILKEGAAADLGLWGKGDLCGADELLLYFVGWRLQKNGTPLLFNLSSQALSKMKKKLGKCFMSPVFPAKSKKRRAKES